MSKNQRRLPQPLRFRQRRSGNLPRSVQLVNNFFSNPEVFFRSAPRGFLPGAEAGTYPDPLSLSTAFFCFFQKTFSPRRARPLGPARLSKTFRPAAARTGYAPPRRLCQRLFIFFLTCYYKYSKSFVTICNIRIQVTVHYIHSNPLRDAQKSCLA